MTVTAVSIDTAKNELSIEQTVADGTPDENVSFELRPEKPGGYCRVWHSAASKQKLYCPAGVYSVHQRNATDGTRAVFWIDAAGVGTASTPSAESSNYMIDPSDDPKKKKPKKAAAKKSAAKKAD